MDLTLEELDRGSEAGDHRNRRPPPRVAHEFRCGRPALHPSNHQADSRVVHLCFQKVRADKIRRIDAGGATKSMIDDGNGWSLEGRNILPSETLEVIRGVIEDTGPVIVEHWVY